MAHRYGLRKCKRPTSDIYRFTELLKCDQIGKIPTFMEDIYVLLHTPIIIIHFSLALTVKDSEGANYRQLKLMVIMHGYNQ